MSDNRRGGRGRGRGQFNKNQSHRGSWRRRNFNKNQDGGRDNGQDWTDPNLVEHWDDDPERRGKYIMYF